jgi:lipoprotein-anchoring transpeptidase ErfK/SrfK
MIVFAIPALQESTIVLPGISGHQAGNSESVMDQVQIQADIQKLQAKLEKYTPTDSYIVINTTSNQFFLYQEKQLIRSGMCSTGKNEKLVSEERKKEYVFHTPEGLHKVQRKQKDPVWAKPDWAFIEEGLPIPPRGDASRFEKGTLGKYKLELGDGYMIHGTLYPRFMGQNVTHGCIRLLDDDLEVVFNTLNVGSKVYIY